MLLSKIKLSASRPMAIRGGARYNMSSRLFATVESNTARQMPDLRPRATPVSHERATFTIRDGPIFHGKSFGARTSISGEAVFTTSLVGYPESLTDPSYRAQVSRGRLGYGSRWLMSISFARFSSSLSL